MRFIPREEKFYDLFEELAEKIDEGAKLFLDMLPDYDTFSTRLMKLKELDHEADIITHRTYEKMHKTFLTPLDREDIPQPDTRGGPIRGRPRGALAGPPAVFSRKAWANAVPGDGSSPGRQGLFGEQQLYRHAALLFFGCCGIEDRAQANGKYPR